MTYRQTIRYLNSFINYEKKSRYPYKQSFKLERIKEFLKLLGNPQDYFKSLHVAGTKGKGSVCSFAAYMLKEAGFKTGLYTSPHLYDCRERIRILYPYAVSKKPVPKTELEGMISRKELSGLVKKIKPLIERFSKVSKYGPLSFFEIYTALAFVYFKEKKIDFAVLETGLGGRLDATNVVSPLACAITSISYDHMNKLGNTLTEIAQEKAGIIKTQNVIVVSAPQEKEVARVIRERCAKENAVLQEIGKDIFFKQSGRESGFQRFNFWGSLGRFNNLKTRLLGRHQLINASTAIALVLALNKSRGTKIRAKEIRRGLINTYWPGRFEVINKSPAFVLDGAHNLASARVLKDTAREIFGGKDIILILGISRDKDIKGICGELLPVTKKLILTKADNLRAARPGDILAQISPGFSCRSIGLTDSVSEAIKLAKKQAKKNDLVLICGSIFVVGEARQLLC